MAKNEITTFDTSFLDKDELGKFNYFEAQLPKQNARVQAAMIEVGKTLLGMQELLAKHSGGKFLKWLEAGTPFGKSSAYSMMAAATVFDGLPNLENIEITALYVLAESGTPEKARKEALRIADKGGRVTHSDAKGLQTKYKEPAAPKPPAKGSSRSAEAIGSSASSQESAQAGNCPRGGDHDFDDEGDCRKCKEPNWGKDQPKPKVSGGTTFNTAEIEAAGCKHGKSNDNGDCPNCGENIGTGKCPACASPKWKTTETGVICAKCGHPHGEPAGDVEADRVSDARSKTVKTCEALMRAFDDLNLLLPKQVHGWAIEACKSLLLAARDWK